MAIPSALTTAAVLLVGCSAAASAESHWNVSLAGLADDNHSQSLEADAAFAPSDSLQLALGGGSSESPSAAGRIDGKSLRGSVDVHSERFGVRGYYRQWMSEMFDTDTLGARASMATGGFTVSLAGETRGFDVDYESGGSNAERSTEHFTGTGWGGGVKYSRAGWTGYADAMFYHYGELSRYVQTNSPGFVPVTGPASGTPSVPPSLLDTVAALPVGTSALSPVLPALSQTILAVAPVLTTSVVTIGEGALDRLVTVGVERAFTRVSLRVNWTGTRDAILSSTTNSYQAGVGYRLSDHVSLGVSAGVTDSYVGSAAFGSASVAFNF